METSRGFTDMLPTLPTLLVWLLVLACFVAWGYFLYQKEFRKALTFLECRKDWRSTGEYCGKLYQSKYNMNEDESKPLKKPEESSQEECAERKEEPQAG